MLGRVAWLSLTLQKTPLGCAIETNSETMVELLLDHGAQVDHFSVHFLSFSFFSSPAFQVGQYEESHPLRATLIFWRLVQT